MPAVVPLTCRLKECLAFIGGALGPLSITYLVPVNIETWAILSG